MPSLTKEEILTFASPFELSIFVETGTFMGDTVNNVKDLFERVYSIELNKRYADVAIERFKNSKNVTIFQGDSSDVLNILTKMLTKPTFFWLDGHWSGGDTARGKKDCPLLEEIDAIVNYCNVACTIVIDDARLFGSKNNEDWLDITHENILSHVGSRLHSFKYFPSAVSPNDRLVIHLLHKV